MRYCPVKIETDVCIIRKMVLLDLYLLALHMFEKPISTMLDLILVYLPQHAQYIYVTIMTSQNI